MLKKPRVEYRNWKAGIDVFTKVRAISELKQSKEELYDMYLLPLAAKKGLRLWTTR